MYQCNDAFRHKPSHELRVLHISNSVILYWHYVLLYYVFLCINKYVLKYFTFVVPLTPENESFICTYKLCEAACVIPPSSRTAADVATNPFRRFHSQRLLLNEEKKFVVLN